MTPAPNRNGEAIVTITVSNGSQQDSTQIRLVVNAVNDAPTITAVGPQTTNEDTTTGDIVFTVNDVEENISTTGSATNLFVTISSDNPILVPDIRNPADLATAGGYTVDVSGGTRTIRIRPTPNIFGRANVTVTVLDRGDPIGTPSSGLEAQRPNRAASPLILR